MELAFRKVLYSREPVCKEIVGNLPGRVGIVCWIAFYFAVKNRTAGVQQLGAIAVEITELKKLDKVWSEVASFPTWVARARTAIAHSRKSYTSPWGSTSQPSLRTFA